MSRQLKILRVLCNISLSGVILLSSHSSSNKQRTHLEFFIRIHREQSAWSESRLERAGAQVNLKCRFHYHEAGVLPAILPCDPNSTPDSAR